MVSNYNFIHFNFHTIFIYCAQAFKYTPQMIEEGGA